MKKLLLLFVALLAVISVSAQDILTRPPSYCAYYYWPHDTLLAKYDTNNFVFASYSGGSAENPFGIGSCVSGTILDKPFEIYGVSVALFTPLYVMDHYGVSGYEINGYDDYEGYYHYPVDDTSRDLVCERIRHYSKIGDSLYTEHEIEWCYVDHPVDWYLSTGNEDLDTPSLISLLRTPFNYLPSIMPMYDLYFDESFPYTPGDTLFLGVAGHSSLVHTRWVYSAYYDSVPVISYFNYPVYSVCNSFHLFPQGISYDSMDWSLVDSFSPTDVCSGVYSNASDPDGALYFSNYGAASMLIYPIIAPPPPEPPAGIQAVEDIEITLGPNPASDRVKVSSSAEITGIAVASIDGRSVYNKPHGGKTATLDIRTWPAGVYFVTVNTPLGSRVHKLLKM